MPNRENMSSPESQKAKRCKIDELIQEKLSGDMLRDFQAFLGFLKEEKITCPWARFGWEGIHTFHIKHKGQNIGEISFPDGENHIRIQINTVDWNKDDFDLYTEGQANEIVEMLMNRLSHKCKNCRPDWGCARASGMSAEVAGKRYEKICAGVKIYKFIGDNMNTLTLYTPLWQKPAEPIGLIPLDMVKKLILARKEYVVKTIC